MKRLIQFVALLAATLAILATACAIGAGPKAPLARDASVGSHRLGAMLNEAGIPVDDAGMVSFYLNSGVPSVLGEPAIDHCALTSVSIDPPSGKLAAYLTCGGHTKLVQTQLTAAQMGAVLNLVKQAAVVQMGTGLQ